MLTQKEIDYIIYWQQQRTNQKQSFVQFIKGMSIGLGISSAIIILIITVLKRLTFAVISIYLISFCIFNLFKI